jgi:hypothetical protein
MPRYVTATLVRHSTRDGLVTMRDHIPIGKQYEVNLDSIEIREFHVTDPRVDHAKHPSHHKEIIWCKPEIIDGQKVNQWFCTELLHIPGHNSKCIYTHKDKDGVLWRFENGRPISIIADEINEEFGFADVGE